jgi:hypothetical protein
MAISEKLELGLSMTICINEPFIILMAKAEAKWRVPTLLWPVLQGKRVGWLRFAKGSCGYLATGLSHSTISEAAEALNNKFKAAFCRLARFV